ncbi:hypothetical protein, partial [Eubacterium aggregans]|uniref:hypothetical protein n=1 Tax=Eubacterium aggregans TaxID=81409 RepID=UPI003F3C4AAC
GKRWVAPSADWYNRTVMNIIEKSREGWHYSSLMALSVIAIKCDIPLAQLEDDVSYIAYIWEERADKFVTPFNAKNLDSAVKMHNPKYRKVTRKQLEEWLG